MNEQNAAIGIIEPVRKRLTVSLPVETAFELFTHRIGQWWPLASHSVGAAQAQACYFEGHVGGRIYEVINDGRQVDWGQVLAWEPHHRVMFTWHPGRTPDTAQQVTVTFSKVPDGTLVELVHTGWDTLGDMALEVRARYVTGWDYVLGKFAAQATVE